MRGEKSKRERKVKPHLVAVDPQSTQNGVNAAGRPIVATSAIDGVRKPVDGTPIPAWTPNVLRRA